MAKQEATDILFTQDMEEQKRLFICSSVHFGDPIFGWFNHHFLVDPLGKMKRYQIYPSKMLGEKHQSTSIHGKLQYGLATGGGSHSWSHLGLCTVFFRNDFSMGNGDPTVDGCELLQLVFG